MRITSNMFAEGFIIDTQKLQKKQIDAQRAISSGQRIHTSSDDPAAFRQSLEIQSKQRSRLQYSDNIRDLTTRKEIDHGTASKFFDIVTRASELLVRVNGSYTQTELNITASEINGILEQALNFGNTQHDGQFLYGGTYLQPSDIDPGTGLPYKPFAETRGVNGEITFVAYQGNTVQTPVEIDENTTIRSNTIGSTGGTNPMGLFTANGFNSFQILIDIRDQLRTGAIRPVIASHISNLGQVEDNVSSLIGTTATDLSRLKIASETHGDRLVNDELSVSKLLDTDMVKEATNLQRSLSAYEAALQTGARVLNTTLLDYL